MAISLGKKDMKDIQVPASTVAAEIMINKQDQQNSGAKEDVTPATKETKSQRLNILVPPSLGQSIADVARAKGISKNEAVNEAISRYVEEYRRK